MEVLLINCSCEIIPGNGHESDPAAARCRSDRSPCQQFSWNQVRLETAVTEI